MGLLFLVASELQLAAASPYNVCPHGFQPQHGNLDCRTGHHILGILDWSLYRVGVVLASQSRGAVFHAHTSSS